MRRATPQLYLWDMMQKTVGDMLKSSLKFILNMSVAVERRGVVCYIQLKEYRLRPPLPVGATKAG